MSTFRWTVIRATALSVVLLVAGTMFVTHPDPDRPNLAMIIGVGLYVVAVALASLVMTWAFRIRRARTSPRTVEVAAKEDSVFDAECQILVIRSPASAEDFLRRYTAQVDGHAIGSIGIGERLSVSLAPGTHTLVAEIAGNRSAGVEIVVNKGDVQVFDIQPTSGSNGERRAGHWLAVVQIGPTKPELS